MRIEEIGNGHYVKAPDKTEHELINVVNRFFNSDMDDFDKSKEAIILEVQKRIKPLIVNLVKKIAWEEGRDIFEPMVNELIEKAIATEIGNIKDLITQIKNNLIKNKRYTYKITNGTTHTLTLPKDSKVVYGLDVLSVRVNGIEQNETDNYTIVIDNKHVKDVVFGDMLDNGDTVVVDCWVYADGSGGTP